MQPNSTPPAGLALLKRAMRVRRRLSEHVEVLQWTRDDERFWRTFRLLQRACHLETRLIERLVEGQRTGGNDNEFHDADPQKYLPATVAHRRRA